MKHFDGILILTNGHRNGYNIAIGMETESSGYITPPGINSFCQISGSAALGDDRNCRHT